ncbi:MAG: IclR family transcriptional regulator [Gammaproteobacteria bacterium]|nr:IclR family transcriptional regulator [Gammaproteobacteria bacterium]MBU1443803.1 IclR family transcriptional regulator [Gammaproteobacteria bacterium]MBU2289395.1 IclR family transcriptional regulator [Gammaproteobacteria bacterium]
MKSNHANSAALRAFRVLEVIAQRQNGCMMAEVVEAVELPKQTVHRLVGTLENAGLVLREPGSRRLQLGSRPERLAIATLMNSGSRNERHAILSAVVESTGETCNLTALAGTDIVYLDRVETSWPLRMMLAPGSHVPLHATSSGKLLASLLPKPQRERLIGHLALRAFTENTIIDREALEAEMRETSRRRIGINRAEHLRGMNGVAVPVMLDRQRACAAVAIQAPEGRMTLEELLVHVHRLREAAAAIGATFGRSSEDR